MGKLSTKYSLSADMKAIFNRYQGLSSKVLAAVSATFVILSAGQYAIARFIIVRSYNRLEQVQVTTNAERLQQTVLQEITELSTLTEDWAWWTDTYEYVKSDNAPYATEYLQADAINTLLLDFLVIFDRNNQPIFAGMIDPKTRTLVTLTSEQVSKISISASQLDPNDLTGEFSGLLLLNQQPALLSIKHLLKSDHSGPSQGALIMGRFLNENMLAAFSETTRLPVEAFLYKADNLPADARLAKAQLARRDRAVTAQVLSEETIASYSLILDLEGQPSVLLKASMNRDIHVQGQTSLKYYLWSTLFTGLTFCGLTTLLLRRLILSRLDSLSDQVNKIDNLGGSDGEAPLREDRRISLSGQDELTKLAHTIDHTLEQLNQRTQELNLAKQAAEEAKEIADRANTAKSSFLANMSHELRTPLNAILGFAQVLSKERTLSDYQRDKLSIINRSGEHLLSLINDVLDMSKIEAGRIELVLSSFDLYHLLTSLQEMLQLKAQSQGTELTVAIAEHLPRYIYSDERKLRQVLLNLLSNALKFTQGGCVKLSVEVDLLEEQQLKRRLTFAIADTGAGISPAEIVQVFQPFVQTRSGGRSQEGTGLGLPISRKFVGLMGGALSVTSQLGKGSTFTFDMIAEIADASDVTQVLPRRQVVGLAPGQRIWRILIVDDNALNRQLLRELLVPVGFEVKEAKNGQQAVDIWHDWEPHLIWMDMQMPVLNGYEATRQIKSHVKGQATAVIALTASAQENERAIVLAAGCDDFMRKPFQQDQLFAKMEEFLGVRYRYETLAPDQPALSEAQIDSAAISSALLAMSVAWNESLHRAAAQLNEKEILALVAKVPEEYSYLRQVIEEKVRNFDFDQIEALAEPIFKRATAV